MSKDQKIEPALTAEEWAKGAWTRRDGVCPKLLRFSHTSETVVEVDGLGVMGEERHALAALCLHGQPFGFTRADVATLSLIAEHGRAVGWHSDWMESLASLSDRIEALLPPEDAA